MNKKGIIENANGNIKYQEELAKAGKDFSAGSIIESKRMKEVAEIKFERSEREQLKELAMQPNPDWQKANAIKEKYEISWNELKILASACVESEVKQIRTMSGLSRNEFAAKYHIPIRTLEKWEREEVKPAEYLVEWLERLVNEDFGGIHRMTKRDLINYIVESEKAYTGLESVKESFERYEEYKALAKEQGYSEDCFDNDIWSQVTRKRAISKGVYQP